MPNPRRPADWPANVPYPMPHVSTETWEGVCDLKPVERVDPVDRQMERGMPDKGVRR